MTYMLMDCDTVTQADLSPPQKNRPSGPGGGDAVSPFYTEGDRPPLRFVESERGRRNSGAGRY